MVSSDPKSPQVGISNTEVQSAYACELAWLYGFHPEMKLQARTMGPARTRGILGHKALEIAYTELKEGQDWDYAAQQALNHIQTLRVQQLMAGDFADDDILGMLNYLFDILTKYFEYYEDDAKHWEVLEVEAFHAMEWENEQDFYLPVRLDMTIYQKSGTYKGETSPVDHKFVMDFYKSPKLRLNSQFPLYQRALRAARFAGKPKPIVHRTIVNQLRTRSLKDPSMGDLFKREFPPFDEARIERVFNNHLKSALRLAWIKRMPLDEAREEVHASLGSNACTFCDFKDMCDVEFEGGDLEATIAATTKPNEYGYPPLEEMRDERN